MTSDKANGENASLVSSSDNSPAVAPEVVYSSAAAYDSVTWMLIAVAFVAIVGSGLMVVMDATVSKYEKWTALFTLAGALAFTIIVFALVLPKEFQVLSDASINVVTFVSIKWNYKGVTAAFVGRSSTSEWLRPKIKYASSFSKQVVVRRKNGAWDLLLSPVDPEPFTNAVFRVAAEKEEK